nr:unnamed protein product [Digitaria exilis]
MRYKRARPQRHKMLPLRRVGVGADARDRVTYRMATDRTSAAESADATCELLLLLLLLAGRRRRRLQDVTG